ncbi:hypothetical protein ACFL1S_00765 [Pseudomonadota bacterium]
MTETANIDIEVDPNELYKEEVFTDRRAGTIRRLTPVTGSGEVDATRPVSYIGQAQILTPMGSVPLAFEIDAASLDEAARKFSDCASVAIAQTQRELEEMRREAASSIVVPQGPGAGMGGVGSGLPGGGKIKLP